MNRKQSSIGDDFIESSLLLTQLDYLKSHNQDLTESFQRTAISRSYYGIYHLARAFANRFSELTKRDKFDAGGGNEHERLQVYYEKQSNNISDAEQKKRFQAVATKIADIRATRNVCDYKDNVPYNLSSKVQQVQRACNQIRESIAGLNIWLDTIEQEYKNN